MRRKRADCKPPGNPPQRSLSLGKRRLGGREQSPLRECHNT